MNAIISRALLLATSMLLIASVVTLPSSLHASESSSARPTVVLVHGAFAGASSWNGVISQLLAQGYPVVAVANPLRSVEGDSQYLASLLASIKGPVVLVGHSYGGNVISSGAVGQSNVKALVYVAAFAPEPGESAATLSAKFPGSTLGPSIAPAVLLPDGGKDLYIMVDRYHDQFAADVPSAEAKLMAATQRPVTDAALNEPSGPTAWSTIPNWFIYGSLDKNIPPAVHAFVAKRAGSRKTIEVQGASHVVMISHPDEVAGLIIEAAAATAVEAAE